MIYDFYSWRNGLHKDFVSDTGKVYDIKPIDDTNLSTHVKCLILDKTNNVQYISDGYIEIGDDTIETKWSVPNAKSYKSIIVNISSKNSDSYIDIL